MDYHDDDVLTAYIWNHYTHLMTDFERNVGHAITGRIKAETSSSPTITTFLRERWGRVDDAEINAVLQESATVFRLRVRNRLIETVPHQIYINRCPNCQRIVRTPTARLCTWCGHTWFFRTKAISAIKR